jgi:hypothetical protein
MPTYYGSDANGADVWVDGNGNYVDQNGNAISPAFPLTPTNTTAAGSLINAGSTVNPNPAVPNTAQGASASSLSAVSNTMGQWGATIASIVAGTPATITSTGAKVGVPAAGQVALAGVNSTMIVLVVAAVVVLLVMTHK